ncbi:hypothetical protein [Glycomyces halotolerans]
MREARERRAQRRKSRLAALSAASMLAVGGAAGMSIAFADEPEAGGSGSIAFSGGCGTLGVLAPSSDPDADEVTVAEGSRVSFTNNLGTDADLHVGGDVYDVSEGSTQVLAMNESAEVAMVPNCRGLFADYSSAQVIVVDAPDTDDDSDDASVDPSPSAAELPSTGSSSSDDSGSEAGSSGGGSDEGDAAGADSNPDFQGTRSDDSENGTEIDREAEVSDEETVSSFGSSDDGAAGGTEFAPAGEEVAAVDPKAVSDGASGLLALVAIVCLVGVSAAVMRTILRQRATA